MTSKTKIDKKLRRKDDLELAKLIITLKKQKNNFWVDMANKLAISKRKSIAVNISKINKETKANDTVIVPGKILGDGELEHNITIACFKTSAVSKEKLKKAKLITIEQLLKQNKEGTGIKVIV